LHPKLGHKLPFLDGQKIVPIQKFANFSMDSGKIQVTESGSSPLERLRIADPETHSWVAEQVGLLAQAPSVRVLSLLADEIVWALSLEAGLGRAVAQGYLDLMARGPEDPHRLFPTLRKFGHMVHGAARTGATLGRLVAAFAPPVLLCDAGVLNRFEKTLAVMLSKGTYTLSAPLEVMSELITDGDAVCAGIYLELLATVFQQEISYNQSLRLVYLLPKIVRGFTPRRRSFQIGQLHRLARVDLQLVEAFQEGMEKGLALLDADALSDFATTAIEKYGHDRELGIRFLGLTSKVGQNACAALQRAVPLVQIQDRLRRYLNARMGRSPAIKHLSELSGSREVTLWVCSDGFNIYLPDEIDRFPRAAENTALYNALVRLEAGYFECRTFDFDLERAADIYPEMGPWVQAAHPTDNQREVLCDGERFVQGFTPPDLARDLFDIFEQARVAAHLARNYPGLVAQVMPVMRREAQRTGLFDIAHPLSGVFARLVLAMEAPLATDPQCAALQTRLVDLFLGHVDPCSPVEASARVVCLAFDLLQEALGSRLNRYAPLTLPFGRRLHWDRVTAAYAAFEREAQRIKRRLQAKKLHVYRSDVRDRLVRRQGRLGADDIVELVQSSGQGPFGERAVLDVSQLELDDLLDHMVVTSPTAMDDGSDAARYPEWDQQLQDYLHDHTCVRDIQVPATGDGDFYNRILRRHRGLVARMRHAFELLKPERLTILRQWPEGDAFDYRALIDFAIDRKAGRIPSDRLFVKRLKQERDVAVLLLTDISRSTSNTVAGRQSTVLDVAKEALVLFCEALQVVGDDYAVAGFSGTGRHAVDYYTVKTFLEPLNDAVQARISALAPQRSTRMGAAIRHATREMAGAQSRVRLIIVVSDGFPNDLGYKADYAIADTRKAVQEARSRNIHVKAITVNIGCDPRLDDLYGRAHHYVIGNVRELPDRLLRLYGTLTRT
jgi:nitric oxide reductase NorD protein